MKYILSITIIFSAIGLDAQELVFNPKHYDDITQRILVVELLQENPRLVKKLTKGNEKKQTHLKEYKAFIKDYNEMIQRVVKEHWTLNEKIEFASTSKVREYQFGRDKERTCLYYTETTKFTGAPDPFDYRSKSTLPTLNYSRADKSIGKADYAVYMPRFEKVGYNLLFEFELVTAINLMQANIKAIKDHEKRWSFFDYAKKTYADNCSWVKDMQIFINPRQLKHETALATITEESTLEVKGSSYSVINDAVMKKQENTLVAVVLPTGIQYSGIGGPRVTGLRVLIDPQTGKIYGVNGDNTGENIGGTFREVDFRKFAKCAE